MTELVITTEEKLISVFRKALKQHDMEKAKKLPMKVFSINAMAKITGQSHATIKKLVQCGIIKTTKDGKITEQEINNYLKDR
jgi:hypothetical protein